MPVLRPKYPRPDWGRCYPKFSSWGHIARASPWGGRRPPEEEEEGGGAPRQPLIRQGTYTVEITDGEITSTQGITKCNHPEITKRCHQGIITGHRKEITKCINPEITGDSTTRRKSFIPRLAQRGSGATTTTTAAAVTTATNNNNNNNKKSNNSRRNSNNRRSKSNSPKNSEDGISSDGQSDALGGVGQRSSSGSNHGPPKRAGLRFGSKAGGDPPGGKTRTPNLNVPLSRTRSGSRSSGGGGSSPAGLHGRAPHKTAVVAPAPSRPTPKNALNRFGFRNSVQAKSGDSTDSVNSILSDAQTCSDSNSNIFDLCDEDNENRKTANGNDSVVGDSLVCDDDNDAFVRARRRLLDSVDSVKVVTATTITTPSRASNVTLPKQPATPNNNALSSRITAHTRQLPKPQVATVKPVSPKVPSTPPVCNSPGIQNSPLSNAVSSRTKSPSIRSLFHTPLKSSSVGDQSPAVRQHLNTALRTPRDSHDSESSTRSATELDSGLGSSSEGDKIRGGEGETTDNPEDSSDAWLKKTRQQQQLSSSKKSRESMEIQFNGTSSFEIKRQSLESKEKTYSSTETKASPLVALRGTQSLLDRKSSESSSSSRDKRGDSTITYGMARQKFAPYSRSRYGYGYQTSQNRSALSSNTSPANANSGSTTSGTSTSTSGVGSSSSGSPGPGATKIPGSSGLVKSRVAMIETPQHVRKTNVQQTPTVLRRSNLKKPMVRPTSLEKTPILVMPVAEKTVELSKPVCRKLEYSENTITTPKKNEAQRGMDQMWENELTQEGKDLILHQVTQPVEDILIVGSVEVETHKDSNVILEADHHGSFYENGYDKGLSSSLDRGEKAFEFASKGSVNNCVGERKAYRDTAEKEKRDEAAFIEVSVCGSQAIGDCAENGKRSAETPDDSGIKLLSPQSESSFEILESLSETVDLTTEDEGRKSTIDLITEEEDLESTAASADTKATDATEDGMALMSPEAKIESSVDSAFSSEQTTVTSVEGDTVEAMPPTAKERPSLVPKSSECILNSSDVPRSERERQDSPTSKGERQRQQQPPPPPPQSSDTKKPPGGVPALSRLSSVDLRSVMESSMESHKSASAVSILTDSGGEHSNHSGKCTPTLNTGRSDLDQDFLIDDEIADQPGLMFGGSNLVSSFFTDDGLFDDIGTSPPPPSHSQLKQVLSGTNRSRANSVDTASSVGGDDLMLDYFDLEEPKAGGHSNRSSVSSGQSLPAAGPTGTRPKKMHLRISIPGRRYDEEVLSPDANEIFSEWTAMMAEVSGASAATERCVSRDGSTSSSSGGGGGGRNSRPRLSSSSAELGGETRRCTVLRPPRQGGLTEMEGGTLPPCGSPGGVGGGGGVFVDRTAYHYMCQDVTSLKTMLLRLRRVLQVADTINPFDVNLRNSLYLSLAGSDSTVSSPGGVNGGEKDPSAAPSLNELSQENVDLRRQVVLLQQQLQERDRTIRLLQQQLAQNLEQQQQHHQQTAGSTPSSTTDSSVSSAEAASGNSGNSSGCNMVNAATQTERSSRPATLRGSSLSRTGSTDDGLGPTVSSEVIIPTSRGCNSVNPE